MSFFENVALSEEFHPDQMPSGQLHGRVLVAMADGPEAARLREILTHVGCEVIAAPQDATVLEVLRREVPDLLLLDFPTQSGSEVLIQRIKTEDATHYLPVMILLPDGGEPDAGLDAGADDFLRHPILPSELVLRVKLLLRLGRMHQDLVDNNSELQSAYETARESEAKYRALIHDAQDALVLVAPDSTTILEANRRAWELSGYKNDDLIGQPVTILCGPERQSLWQDLLSRVTAQGRAALENNFLQCKDGEIIPVEVHASLANHHLGEPLIQMLIRDIRPRQQLEAERTKSERFSAVVETAVTVNHEINNPLLVITSSVEFLQRSLFNAESGVRERLERINEACGRIQRFTQQLASVIAPVSKEYLPGMKMLDIQQSVAAADDASQP